MDLYKLKYFHIAAAELNFSGAAKKCFITQSALSQSIKQLEGSLNTKLFNRSGKKISLTETGGILYSHSKNIFSSIDAARSEITSHGKQMVGEIRIATTTNIGIYSLLKPIKKWIKTYPQINLVIKYEDKQACLDLVDKGLVELAIVPDSSKNTRYQEIKLFEDEWTLVCSAKHPLAQIRKVRSQDLNKFKLLIPSRNQLRQKDLGQKIFEKHGVFPEILLEANSSEALKEMAIHSMGFCFLPRRMIRKEVENGTLKDLSISKFVLPHDVSIVHLKSKTLSFIDRRFLDFLLKEICA